jgi:hypothetical protein
MKRLGFILMLSVVSLLIACSEDERDTDFINDADAPSEVSLAFVVTNDDSGLVSMTPSGVGASFFDVFFTENTETAVRLFSRGSH